MLGDSVTAALHAGVQLAKMSPFRSYVVTTASTLTSIVAVALQLGGGISTYINVSLSTLLALCYKHHSDCHNAEPDPPTYTALSHCPVTLDCLAML